MRFEINGKNEKDKYSYTIDKDISFAFHERYIEILFKENNKDIFIFNNFFLFLDDDIKKNLTKDTRLELLKDSRSNLSWIHTHKNGKVYMLKHYNDNNECSVCDDTYPDPSNIEDWKPIKQTLGSNIKYWKYLNISDYKSIQEKDRPSPIKRFLRTFVTCQDGMTGECLLDPECFNCCTTSGYNEESFYSKENVDKKGSQEIEQ